MIEYDIDMQYKYLNHFRNASMVDWVNYVGS